ncbi:MAG: hypothetical protein WC600_11520 [Desulfobaccales bacterium]
MRSLRVMLWAILLIILFQAPPASGVTLGQVDNFEDGTTQNWVVGLLGAPHPAPPVNVATGGPAGAGDHYLLLTAIGGGGAGSRLTVINASQWTGDFIAAGIDLITMAVNNLGSTELALRLLFEDPTVGPPENIAFSTEAVIVPPGSGWISVLFPISPADLSAALGDVTTALTHATVMRLYHSSDPGFPGPAIAASLGVDNIAAVPVPVTAILFGSGLVAMLFRQRWKN